MAWIDAATKINGGYLTGKLFNRSAVTVSSWINAPNSSWVTMGRVQCTGVDMEDFNVASIGWAKQLAQQINTVWWAIDVDQDQYYHVSLIGFFKKTGTTTCELNLKLRIFTDETTYTDSDITVGNMVTNWYEQQTANSTHLNPVFKQTYYNGTNYILIGCYIRTITAAGRQEKFDGWAVPVAAFKTLIGGDIPESEESPEFGPAAEPAGYTGKATFDDHSDRVDFPTDPASVISLGFINVYKCDVNSLSQLGETIFPDVAAAVDVPDAISKLSDAIWNSRLIDYVISVHVVPGNVTGGTLEAIKVGTRTLQGIMGRPVSNEYFEVDFQSIHTDDIFENYADMNCTCKLFLPFYGYISLPPEAWNGGDIHVKYKFNVIDGSFMAYVESTSGYSKLNSVIGQYGGTACVHIPTTGANYASMFSTLIGAGTQVAASAAKGNAVGAASSLLNVAANMGAGGGIEGSGNYNASSSFMSMRKPFLLLELPVPQFSSRFEREHGLPSYVSMSLATLTGFVQCDKPEITFSCTDEEAEEIRKLLEEGVIL